VTSPELFVGKTAVCLGLGMKFRDEGYKVGYFKPIGSEMGRTADGKPYDEDAVLMKDTLELRSSLEEITPVILKRNYLEETLKVSSKTYSERIGRGFKTVSEGMDVLLIEGICCSAFGAHFNLSVSQLSKIFNSKILLISKFQNDCAVDELLREKLCIECQEGEILGYIFNDVRRQVMQRVQDLAVPILEKNGLRNWGVIPGNVRLTSPTVKEIYENLGGELLAGEDRLDTLVERFLVGAMTPESALSYFRRATNKAVVTGGDRSDIALAALETDTRLLILTGNLYPSVRVLAKADEQGVPVLLVPYDTYTTIDKVSQISGRIKPGDSKRIELTRELVAENVSWDEMISTLTC
jgi:BioD-like phosphotransacetylase family protein